MMIEKYIHNLLFRYDCVIIPGFGGIITSHCPAIIQNDEHLFYPPSKFLAFNKNLNKQDGLLANYISEQEKISYNEAILQIDQFVRTIQHKINKGEKVSLTNIGIFTTDKEKNILFTPDKHINYLTDSFGLATFYASPVKRMDHIPIRKEPSKGVMKRLLPSRLKPYHLAFAASLALFASVWLPFDQNTKSLHVGYSSLNSFESSHTKEAPLIPSSPIQLAQLTNQDQPIIETAEDLVTSNTENSIYKSQPKDIEEKIIATKETTNSHSKKQYYIIAGVFAQKENAEKMLQKLSDEGFTNSLIVDQNKKGLYRVAFESYAEENHAEDALSKIKLSHKRSAWILKK